MKKLYLEPEISVNKIAVHDLITTSPTDPYENDENWDGI